MKFLRIKSSEISWNLLRMFYRIGKWGRSRSRWWSVCVCDNEKRLETPSRRDETTRKPLSRGSMNLEVYIRHLNKTVRSNQHNDRESSRCFVRLSEVELIRDESLALLPDFSPSSSLSRFIPFHPLYLFHFLSCGNENSHTESKWSNTKFKEIDQQRFESSFTFQ